MIFQTFSSGDLFRLPVAFYFNGYGKRSSIPGMLFSLGIYIFLLYTFVQSDMFLKKSPIVVSQSLKTKEASLIRFDENKLIMFSVTDAFSRRQYDPTIFNIKFKYFYNDSYFEYKALKLCTEQDVAFNTSLFKLYNMKKAFCLVNKSLILDGDWDENSISYAAVSLFLCDNLTSNMTCKSQEEIDAFFNNWSSFKFFTVSFHDSQIDLYDYENPFKITYKSEFQFVDTSIKKRYNIFLKTANVHTDDGWIIPNIKTQSNIMFDTKEFDFQMRTDKAQPVFQMLFYASKEAVESRRRYQKLPEILGSMIGISHLILFACSLVTNLFIHVSTLKQVLNKLYFFPKILTQKKKKKKPVIPSKDLINNKSLKTETDAKMLEKHISDPMIPIVLNKISNSNILNKILHGVKLENTPRPKTLKEDSFTLEHFSQNDLKLDSIKDDLKNTTTIQISSDFVKTKEKIMPKKEPAPIRKKRKIFEIFRKKKIIFELMDPLKTNEKNLLNLSFLEYFWYKFKKLFCCKPSPKYQLIEKAEKAFEEDMDVLNIMTKLHDLEKLKLLLLDEDQLVLFKYLSKSIISPNDESLLDLKSLNHSQTKMLSIINSGKNSINLTEESYKKILANKEPNIVNKRLIELFDERILKCTQHD